VKPQTRTTGRNRTKEPERHRWFDPWLTVKVGTPLQRLTGEAARLIDEEEGRRGTRKRQRKEIDRRHHRERVATVVINLAYAVLMPPQTARLALQLGNRVQGLTRYDNPALGAKPMRVLIPLLEDLNCLSLNSSALRGEVSSIAPTTWFADKVQEFAVSLADFGRHKSEELIILKCKKRISSERKSVENLGERVDYRETNKTRAMRKEVRELNAFLAKEDITFLSDGGEPIDPFRRTLVRHFVIHDDQPERFDQVGRLFGAFWLSLKSERRRNILIRGEPIATLDYGSMFTRLAYAHLGIEAPAGDLYAIEGAEGFRSGIKMAMNVFLFDRASRRASWPATMGVGAGNDQDALDPTSRAATFEARLPAGWTVGGAKKAISRRHPQLATAWGKGLGLGLMFMESRILIAVLNELKAQDIPALGLHDGLMVQRSKKDVAREAMERIARKLSGATIPVSEKT
jgi:hypothetical protein